MVKELIIDDQNLNLAVLVASSLNKTYFACCSRWTLVRWTLMELLESFGKWLCEIVAILITIERTKLLPVKSRFRANILTKIADD